MIKQHLLVWMFFIEIWSQGSYTMDVMVKGSNAAQVATLFHDKNMPFSIAIGDIAEYLPDTKINNALMSNRRKVLDWKNYHRLDVIYAFMDKMAADYPYLCSIENVGVTAEGRDLKVLKISNGLEENTGIWIDGCIHAREWVTVSVVTYIINYLVKNFSTLPTFLQDKNWYIMPVINPDGYEYCHTTDRMWRKNRRKFGECVGVDLNRNFSQGWGVKGEDGSSNDPGSIFYRGPKAFSEAETMAVRDTILKSETEFKYFISYHSYGEVIIFPWGHTEEACPDYIKLLEAGTAMAKEIYKSNGNTYKVGSTKDLMYYSAGVSTDWSYETAEIPYSYMVELRGKKARFLLPKEEIESVCKESLMGLIRLIEFTEFEQLR